MSQIYYAILTNAGEAKLATAIALGVPLKLTHMGVGDGNGKEVTPDPTMTTLPGEQRRAAINTLFADPLNAAQLVAEQVIPADEGGWWVRCVGLYDEAGTLVAIANAPASFKPLLATGAGRTQVIRMALIVSNTAAVELKIDPAVVLATRKYCDDRMAELLTEHAKSRAHPDATQTDKGMTRLANDQESLEGKSKSVAATPAGVAALLGSRFLAAGSAFPASNIGPIWHDDYGGWMHWQEFTQNGADYRGYASQGIGSLLLDTQPTPRQGYIKSGVQNLSRVTYAALRAWALHHGRMVAPATWQAGQIVCADNTDGTTFRVYDVRGEFLRAWDDSRGIDVGRELFTLQGDATRNVTALIGRVIGTGSVEAPSGACEGVKDNTVGGLGSSGINLYRTTLDISRQVPTAAEVRPRNTALLAIIKF